MAYYEFIWLDSVVQKLADRGISTEDVEAVVCHPFSQDVSRSTGLPVVFGWLPDGRYVMVPYKEIDDVLVQVVSTFVVPEPTR